jgi:hypothetical protein
MNCVEGEAAYILVDIMWSPYLSALLYTVQIPVAHIQFCIFGNVKLATTDVMTDDQNVRRHSPAQAM